MYWRPSIASIPYQHTPVCFFWVLYPLFHCQYSQLTFCVLGKYPYHFTFVLPVFLFYSNRFCVHYPCPFRPPLHQTWYALAKNPHNFIFVTSHHIPLCPLLSKYLAKEVSSWHHGHPSQRHEVLVPTVILPVRTVPEPIKVRSWTEAVIVLQIRPPSSDLPYICHHPLRKLEFGVVLFALAVSVKIRCSHQELGRILFTAQQRAGRTFLSESMSS